MSEFTLADCSSSDESIVGAQEEPNPHLLLRDSLLSGEPRTLYEEIDSTLGKLVEIQGELDKLSKSVARATGEEERAQIQKLTRQFERQREALLRDIRALQEELRHSGADFMALETFLSAILAGGTTEAQQSFRQGVSKLAQRGPLLSRGYAWVRAHPMVISALNVSMGQPPRETVDRYFSEFHATAAHLWATGLPDEAKGWAGDPHFPFPWVSWTQENGTSAANGLVIGGYQANPPGRIGYQIGDEPAGMAELFAIEAGVNTVRAADPDALIIINFPSEGEEIDEMLQYFGEHMDADIISYSDYTQSQRAYEFLARFRSAGLRFGIPYWRYLKAYEAAGETNWPTESDMRWNAFSGLVYGYTGHTWFVYQAHPAHKTATALFETTGDFTSPATPRFGYGAQINLEMAALGRVITHLTSTDVRYLSSIGGLLQPNGTQPWQYGAGNDPYITEIKATGPRCYQDLLVGYFQNNRQQKYFIIQNVNHTNGEFPVWGDSTTNAEITFDFSSAGPSVDKNILQVISSVTGRLKDLPLENLGGDKRRLRVTLAAGNSILLKYKTIRQKRRG